jgi:hypothetical protein
MLAVIRALVVPTVAQINAGYAGRGPVRSVIQMAGSSCGAVLCEWPAHAGGERSPAASRRTRRCS